MKFPRRRSKATSFKLTKSPEKLNAQSLGVISEAWQFRYKTWNQMVKV